MDWTELDRINDRHYNRYPQAVVVARKALQDAAEIYAASCDALEAMLNLWLRGLASDDEVRQARSVVKETWKTYEYVQGYHDSIYEMWFKGTLPEQIFDKIIEQNYRDAEIAEDMELWRIGKGG